METHKLLAIIVTLLSGGYLLPWGIALWRGDSDTTKIFLINLLLGWTVIGWVIALVMSLR